jgi:hypothetical protein
MSKSDMWGSWQPTEYFMTRMQTRKVSLDEVMETLRKPDDQVASGSRTVYQKRFGRKLLRIIAEGNILITVYKTSHFGRYEGR